MTDGGGLRCDCVQQERGLTLGISIVQGTDNNVYVKDLVRHGPGEMSGIQIGDQVRADFIFFLLFFYF